MSVIDKHGKRLQTIQCDKFIEPISVSLDKDRNIYVTDSIGDSLFKFNKKGECVEVLRKRGSQLGEFNGLRSLRVILFVCDMGNHRI